MSKYEFVKIENNNEWDNFVSDSLQGTIFSMSIYLNALNEEHEYWNVIKGQEIVAGIALLISDEGAVCGVDDLVIYNGILFRNDPTVKLVKSNHEKFEVTEFIISELVKRFKSVRLSLSPEFKDLRPFLWHNYHSTNNSEKFLLKLRYTSYLNIEEFFKNEDDIKTLLYKNLETLRKRNIKEARSSKTIVVKENQFETLLEFYRTLMLKQGEIVEDNKIDKMLRIMKELSKNNKGMMFCSKNRHGEIIYITFFCYDNKRAYYLFGAGNPNATERYKGTLAFWDAFRILAKEHKIKEVDFEGVNSPKRGWFKLSFGGSLIPYYDVCLK